MNIKCDRKREREREREREGDRKWEGEEREETLTNSNRGGICQLVRFTQHEHFETQQVTLNKHETFGGCLFFTTFSQKTCFNNCAKLLRDLTSKPWSFPKFEIKPGSLLYEGSNIFLLATGLMDWSISFQIRICTEIKLDISNPGSVYIPKQS